MYKIAEASLPDAMEFVFDNFIKSKELDPRGLLAYRPAPKNKKDKDSASWYRDNPTTGIIYLDKHPNAREAWVLVKFERRKDAKLCQPSHIQHFQNYRQYFSVCKDNMDADPSLLHTLQPYRSFLPGLSPSVRNSDALLIPSFPG